MRWMIAHLWRLAGLIAGYPSALKTVRSFTVLVSLGFYLNAKLISVRLSIAVDGITFDDVWDKQRVTKMTILGIVYYGSTWEEKFNSI